MNETIYNKPYHYIGSPSVFWDLDSLVYIVVLGLIIWGIIRLVGKIRHGRKMSILEYGAKWFFTAYVPVFLLFFISLMMSGNFIATNLIISFLPLVYGIIIQVVLLIVKKVRS